MLAVAALAGVAAVWEPAEDLEPSDQVQAEVEPPPLLPLKMIEGAPPNFWRLAAERLLEELEDVMSGLEVRDDDDMYDIFVKVPPGQRERMLRELDNIYGKPQPPP